MEQSAAQAFQSVTIVGGGPVGGSLACALVERDIPTHVVDVRPLEDFLSDTTSDCRAIAVSPTSRNLLTHLHIWPHLKDHFQPILEIKTVHGSTDSEVSFTDEGNPLGSIIPMSLLRQAIAKRVQDFVDQGKIHWHRASLESVQKTQGGPVVTLSNGETLQTQALVGADGKNSSVRNLGGFDTTTWGYGKEAIVCTFDHSNDHQSIAWEIFLEEGPFAILPMTQKRSSIVWSVQEDIAHALKNLSDEAFDALIEQKLSPYLNDIKRVSPRWIYPIGIQFSETYAKDGLFLVGDAAHVMHPLAGQGLNMGFRDVAALAGVVHDQQSLGLPLNDAVAYEKYQKWRRFDNLSMLFMTDSLDVLFSNGRPSLKRMREWGMKAMAKDSGLKTLFSKSATGKWGQVPKLLDDQISKGAGV